MSLHGVESTINTNPIAWAEQVWNHIQANDGKVTWYEMAFCETDECSAKDVSIHSYIFARCVEFWITHHKLTDNIALLRKRDGGVVKAIGCTDSDKLVEFLNGTIE